MEGLKLAWDLLERVKNKKKVGGDESIYTRFFVVSTGLDPSFLVVVVGLLC